MGRFASRKSGLGTFSDSGRNRVPAPDNVAAPVPQNPPGMRVRSDVRGFPKWVRRSSSCTDLWWGRDHDDDDDVLLGAGGHGCSTSAPMAERERWDGRGEREEEEESPAAETLARGGPAAASRCRHDHVQGKRRPAPPAPPPCVCPPGPPPRARGPPPSAMVWLYATTTAVGDEPDGSIPGHTTSSSLPP
jgi:hypothetical protein